MKDAVTFKVGGLTCEGCVQSLRQALEAVPGINQARISLDTGLVTVHYDPTRITPGDFNRIVSDTGYDVIQSPLLDA